MLFSTLHSKSFINGHIYDRAVALTNLQHELDVIQDERVKQTQFDALPDKTKEKLDLLWGQLYSDNGRKNIPLKGGCWTGEPGDSIWIPRASDIPPNKGYSNMDLKTWGQIMRENRISGIAFRDGRADFRPVSKYDVVFDWEDHLGKDGIRYLLESGDRQHLHMKAFLQLSKKLGISEDRVINLKETLNLVWHEEPDCKTMRLVVREVHDNIKHFGGIAMLAIIYD